MYLKMFVGDQKPEPPIDFNVTTDDLNERVDEGMITYGKTGLG